ncbi:MAG TPA: ferritin-like domain-containing protein [Solirubrobacteraceae bacterium]|nr:ferritin-like domain-containing protein [Solirubrobacteraceae bacterium]
MFDKLETPQDVFHHQLGAALKMENTVLQMLGDLEEAATREPLKQQLRHHADETREQIRNLEQAFAALGEDPDDKPCPAIEGIEKEGQANIKKAQENVVDAVILSGAAETEHHEIAVYEGLITEAQAMGKQDIVVLLQRNLEQEEHTLEEVKQARRELAHEQFAGAA